MAEEAPMVELEEQVDLDSDNYNEEMDDEVEEQLEEDRIEGAEDENAEEEPPLSTEEVGKNQLPETDRKPHDDDESVVGVEKPTESMDGDDKKKYAELLALPPHGSEVFIGGVPKDVTEEDLRGLCEPVGEVTEVRLMKDKGTGESKGYAFITFKTKEFAQQAIEDFQNKEFKGRTLRCSLSQAKHKLFIGSIPKGWTEKDLRVAIEKNGPGVEHVDLVKDPQNPGRNRGFAFIEYYNSACADYARQKMSEPHFKLEGNTPTVSWAETKTTADPSALAQVKALYVKNLPGNATTEKLKDLFQRHGEVTKVVLPPAKAGQSKRDFGFIHYAERSSALKAVKNSETYEIEGQILDVSMAKPQNEKKFEQASYPQRQGALPSYHPQPAYGFVGDPYGALGSGYAGAAAPAYQPPVIYGRGPMPSGMQMVPMVLPDGQIGYVLQQPDAQAQPPPPPPPRRHERRNDYSGGSRGRGGSPGRGDGSRGRRYRPY
ncbi:hypothetical protein AQUCO_03700259v1 [Aquilegia coerulea]|uniref:RRM domain-containing protein n=1 Tax=Aquilegia coerulea TaxID=218851 RepID=A0A2G5CUA5_AQUCA|nr:hypothetical protein AQUCO_03700259v1 [Aquilegia coerulea]PIA34862.1 hypothetical protein AQUCO_03700259v1 [Aquilegia coerulea]